MCRHCEGNHEELEIYGAAIHTRIETRYPAVPQLVQSVATDKGVLTNSISIKFCPICGRTLTQENP